MKTSAGLLAAWATLLCIGAAVAALWLHGPIPQDPSYHHFADARDVFSIPNFGNVVSNVPFLFVGLSGLMWWWRAPPQAMVPELRQAYLIFFLAVAAVAFGSGFYHWRPDNNSLVWDRLPMTVAFMAVFSILLAERVSLELAMRVYGPLLAAGVFSVAYWHFTDLQGRGDLRPYALVQFLPMLLTPLILLARRRARFSVGGYWWLLGLYVLAKALEHWDEKIFRTLGFISGHSLKHLAAASGCAALLISFNNRKRANES